MDEGSRPTVVKGQRGGEEKRGDRQPGGKGAGLPGRSLGGQEEGSGFISQGHLSVLKLGKLLTTHQFLPSVMQEPGRQESAGHLLAVLVVVFADVAQVSSKCLHGQGAGDLYALPLNDHS